MDKKNETEIMAISTAAARNKAQKNTDKWACNIKGKHFYVLLLIYGAIKVSVFLF